MSDQAIPDRKDRKDGMAWIAQHWLRRKEHSPMLAGFRDALTREILLTERLRIKAVVITASLLTMAFTLLHLAAPSVLNHISHGRFNIAPQFAILLPFVLFELFVLHLLNRRLAMHRDVPTLRRYLSALIETSTPTFVPVSYTHLTLPTKRIV